jgi:hypothetical protein
LTDEDDTCSVSAFCSVELVPESSQATNPKATKNNAIKKILINTNPIKCNSYQKIEKR